MDNRNNLFLEGRFWKSFVANKGYTNEIIECIKETTLELINKETNANKPGILLGKVQSGKTRTFMGIIALGFDNGYDVSVVLTKGTKALARQTIRRLKEEFDVFVKGHDLQIYDIMTIGDLTRYTLKKKLIFVVKKEDDNMKRLEDLFFNTYRELSNKNVLIIDDEADLASIGFSNSQELGMRMNVVANQINQFRKMLNNRCDLLQVTATPYSLYLQPEDIVVQGEVFQPLRPAFTKLVPLHDKYIGGNEYFDNSSDENSIFWHLWEEVSEKEMSVLSNPHGSYLNNVMTSPNLNQFRKAIIGFIVGAIIRRLQDKDAGRPEKMFSFIIHTDVARIKHSWQLDLATRLKEVLEDTAQNNSELLKEYVENCYLDFKESISKLTDNVPSFERVNESVKEAIADEYLGIYRVNSDSDIETLLNENGQLNLDNPLNIFIGGQILDRGVTIENLIGFFYGRNPNTFQLDTVLQHSRMYGARPMDDIAVTRFYTTHRIYNAMKRMHEIDCALRSGFEKNEFDKGVIFIQKDTQRQIKPCSPNKILLSETISLVPSGRLIPVGFNTTSSNETRKSVDKIEALLLEHVTTLEHEEPILMDNKIAGVILTNISETMEFDEGYDFDWDSFITTMKYLSNITTNEQLQGKIYVMLRGGKDGRQASRFTGDKFNGKPESTDVGREGYVAKQMAVDIPFLLLLKQKGERKSIEQENIKKDIGWKGTPFWWPVLYIPSNMKPLIYSTERVN